MRFENWFRDSFPFLEFKTKTKNFPKNKLKIKFSKIKN